MRSLVAAVLVLLVLVAGLALAADLVVMGEVEERAAARVTDELGAPAEVDVGGWPVTLRVLAGQAVPRIDVRATDVPAGGGTLDRLDVTLIDVPLDVGDLRGGIEGLPPAASATFEAEVREQSLQEMVPAPAAVVAVTLAGDRAHFDLAGLGTVEALVGAEDGMIVIEPQTPLAALVGLARIPVDLSDQPGEPYVEEVEVTEGALVLRGRLAGLELPQG